MKLDNKQYDFLKLIALKILPAIGTFVGTVGTALNWEFTAITVTIITAFDAMLGTMLGISTDSYNKEEK
ncbi:phage holin [Enterococcus italicus]|uniref:phage holin n=1 Tax=Enterococcus italicus TaxID=246144 RepID=UPI0028A8DE83|nr:phage holin [Enterococcus italicus]